MTESGAVVRDVPDTSASPRRSRRRWWVAAAVALIIALIIVSLAVYWHWRTSARELFGYGRSGVGYSAGKIGETYYVDAAVEPLHAKSGHKTLDVRRIHPLVAANTARARVVVLICHREPGDVGIGSTTRTDPYCASAKPFSPGVLDLGFAANQVIYAITARQLGVVRVEGSEVSFTDGSRSGTQHVGARIVDHVRAATK